MHWALLQRLQNQERQGALQNVILALSQLQPLLSIDSYRKCAAFPGCCQLPGYRAVGKVKQKVEPSPGAEFSSHMRPPYCSTNRLQIARPMPLPGYSCRLCNRLKSPKMRSANFGSMPIPLSATENTDQPSCSTAEMCTRGAFSLLYFRALLIKF